VNTQGFSSTLAWFSQSLGLPKGAGLLNGRATAVL
jgi:hypothetical protein